MKPKRWCPRHNGKQKKAICVCGETAPSSCTVDSLVRMEIGLRLLKRASALLKRYQHHNAETLYCAIDEYLFGIGDRIKERDANAGGKRSDD